MKMKSKTKKKSNSELFLSMDSPVYIIEKKNGKEVSKDPIDSGIVLKLLLNAITEGIGLLEASQAGKKVNKNAQKDY